MKCGRHSALAILDFFTLFFPVKYVVPFHLIKGRPYSFCSLIRQASRQLKPKPRRADVGLEMGIFLSCISFFIKPLDEKEKKGPNLDPQRLAPCPKCNWACGLGRLATMVAPRIKLKESNKPPERERGERGYILLYLHHHCHFFFLIEMELAHAWASEDSSLS